MFEKMIVFWEFWKNYLNWHRLMEIRIIMESLLTGDEIPQKNWFGESEEIGDLNFLEVGKSGNWKMEQQKSSNSRENYEKIWCKS